MVYRAIVTDRVNVVLRSNVDPDPNEIGAACFCIQKSVDAAFFTMQYWNTNETTSMGIFQKKKENIN